MFARIHDTLTGFTKSCEDAASGWWDQHLRRPTTLERLGKQLNRMSALKARWDRTLEQSWATWRLPSALDVERLHERLGELEEQLVRVEDLLAERARGTSA